MGLNIQKIEYDCDIMHDPYTSCDKKNCYVMVLSRSTDFWRLFHKHHDDEFESISTFTDNQIKALQKIFSDPGDHTGISNEEFLEIREKLFKP